MTDIDYLKKYLPKDKLADGIKKLEEGTPVQYIVGNVDFYNVNLLVNKDVLIPRFETEFLVDKLVGVIGDIKGARILDMCCGSGAIGIALSKKFSDDIVIGADISKAALEVAFENNKRNNTSVEFIDSDLFSNISGKFDVIVSNPPYIGSDDYVMDIVKNNEPAIALFADNNGLEFYEKIISSARNYLNEHYIMAFELGDHADEVLDIAYKYFSNANIWIENDLQGIKRYLFIKE